MLFDFTGKRIEAICTAVPKNEVLYDDDAKNYGFSFAKSQKLKALMGYDKHRLALEGQIASDFAIACLEEIFKKTDIDRSDIDALVYVTQSPDYLIPHTSCIIQNKLGLKNDILCVDINQGCAGFEQGLFQAFSLLQIGGIKKVALVCADILSHRVNKRDRNSHPLIGDGGAAAIISNSTNGGKIYCYNKVFGDGAFAINIPAGGFKMPSSAQTAIENIDADGNARSLDNLAMEGASVFSFVQEKVPPMIDELLACAKLSKDDIDYYLFHQPNKFMLEKLADKVGISPEKMPNNIVAIYGNASSVTVPTNICHNLRGIVDKRGLKVFLAGFGVGLTVSGIVMDFEKMKYCNIIEI